MDEALEACDKKVREMELKQQRAAATQADKPVKDSENMYEWRTIVRTIPNCARFRDSAEQIQLNGYQWASREEGRDGLGELHHFRRLAQAAEPS